MFVLALQGSPFKDGNAGILLTSFLEEAERLGCQVCNVEVGDKLIAPCRGCRVCENTGYCALRDDMEEISVLLRQADLIVIATPIFFYSVPSQLKALIDRSQTMWARKYIHRLIDPGDKWRVGFLLALGATKGKNLFEGASLTARYFFDAIGAQYSGSLTFRQIEQPGAIKAHPTALTDAKKQAALLVKPFLGRKKILFICKENSCRSQMASALARYYAGDRIEAESAGSEPADKVNDTMVEVMSEKGIDMAFRKPRSINDVVTYMKPDLLVTMGCEEACPIFPGSSNQEWDLPDPADKPISFMRNIRDDIEQRVAKLIKDL